MKQYDEMAKCSNCNKTPVAFEGAKLCHGCWECERNIEDFVLGLNGREHVREALRKVGLQLTPIPGPVSGPTRGKCE